MPVDTALTGNRVVGIGLLVVLVVATAWDAYAVASGNTQSTVSGAIREWSTRWPVVPFLAGFLCGHLFGW